MKTLTLDGDYSVFSDGRSVDNEMEGQPKVHHNFIFADAEVNSKVDMKNTAVKMQTPFSRLPEMDSVSMYQVLLHPN